MVEVLITMVILAFGLLGLINLQVRLQMNEVESYQRGQALVLLEDMASRMRAIPLNVAADVDFVASYVTPADSWIGTDGTDCTTYPAGPVQTDICAWSNLLEGAAIAQAGTGLGAMKGARGCIEQIAEGNPAAGICTPAVYRVSLAWQGLYESAAPAQSCGAGQYGDKEGFRRVVSTLVQLGTPRCLPP